MSEIISAFKTAKKYCPKEYVVAQLFAQVADTDDITWHISYYNHLKDDFKFAMITSGGVADMPSAPVVSFSGSWDQGWMCLR